MFNKLDSDSSGGVGKEEIQAIINHFGLSGPGIDEASTKLLDDADPSGDGDISFEEFRRTLKLPVSSHGGPVCGVAQMVRDTHAFFNHLAELSFDSVMVWKMLGSLVLYAEKACALRSRHRYMTYLADATDMVSAAVYRCYRIIDAACSPTEDLPFDRNSWIKWWSQPLDRNGNRRSSDSQQQTRFGGGDAVILTRREALNGMAVHLERCQATLQGSLQLAGCLGLSDQPGPAANQGHFWHRMDRKQISDVSEEAMRIMEELRKGRIRSHTVAGGHLYIKISAGKTDEKGKVTAEWRSVGHWIIRLRAVLEGDVNGTTADHEEVKQEASSKGEPQP